MGRVASASETGGEVVLERRLSTLARPLDLGSSSASLPTKRWEGRCFERQHDPVHHLIQVSPHVAAPEPQHLEAMPPENAVAHSVVLGVAIVAVLVAVDLDDKPAREAGKVQIVAAERILSADVIAAVA